MPYIGIQIQTNIISKSYLKFVVFSEDTIGSLLDQIIFEYLTPNEEDFHPTLQFHGKNLDNNTTFSQNLIDNNDILNFENIDNSSSIN